jgi:hypothetical protein
VAARALTNEERAAARRWGPAEEEQVMHGTGCYNDLEAVRQALHDATGDTDQVTCLPALSNASLPGLLPLLFVK